MNCKFILFFLLLSLGLSLRLQAQSRATDSMALVALRDSFPNQLTPIFGGAGLGTAINRLNTIPYLSLHPTTGRVLALELQSLGLQGPWPEGIITDVGLSALQSINLEDNQLTNISGSFTGNNNAALQTILLSRNQFAFTDVNFFNRAFGNCRALNNLNMANAVDTVLSQSDILLNMSNWPSLQILNLTGDSLELLKLDFGNASSSSLQELRLSGNKLHDEFIRSVDFSNLQFLSLATVDVSYNNLTQFAFPNAPNLSTCDFQGNYIHTIAYQALPIGGYPNLLYFYLTENFLDYEDLTDLVLKLGFVPNLSTVPMTYLNNVANLNFSYAPQRNFGTGGLRRRAVGDSIIFRAPFNSPSDTVFSLYLSASFNRNCRYRWSRSQVASQTQPGASQFSPLAEVLLNVSGGFDTLTPATLTHAAAPLLQIRNWQRLPQDNPNLLLVKNLQIATHHDYWYTVSAYNALFPDFDLVGGLKINPKKVVVGDCFDSLNRPIRCQEVVVQFREHITAEVRDSLRNSLGMELIDSCACGNVEWWAISDTANLFLEEDGRGTRNSTTQVRTKSQLLSASSNYNFLNNTSILADANPGPPTGTTSASRTLVAIIDAGLDTDNPDLSDKVWLNQGEIPMNGQNDDQNCLTDDAYGYNFLEEGRNPQPYDDHGHGTQVAGIVAGVSQPAIAPQLDSIAILPLKYTNRDEEGTLFHAACALYYAANFNDNGQKVRVINASWGYYGEPSEVLETAFNYIDSSCQILVVTSAGNDGLDNDTLGHYPSDYRLGNMLSVASIDSGNPEILASFSNHGRQEVDLAAEGYFRSTTSIIGGVSAMQNVSGTSFSAAAVTRAAALLFNAYPTASPQAVRQALTLGVDTLQSADSLKLRASGRLNYSKALQVLSDMDAQNRSLCTPGVVVGINPQVAQVQRLRLQPNPFRQTLQLLRSEAWQSDARWQLFDLEGRLLKEGILPEGTQVTELNLEALNPGFYFLRCVDAQQQETHKILKMN